MRDSDPGAPEALPRTVRSLTERFRVEAMDCLFVFPPLTKGRKEWGLVVISEMVEDDDRRRLHTARYVAELTGRGLTFEMEVTEEGILPPDRIGRLLSGVARRTEIDLGDPRRVEIGGDPEALESLLEEWSPSETEAWTP